MRPCPVLTLLQWLWNLSEPVQQCWASADVWPEPLWMVVCANMELLCSMFNIFLILASEAKSHERVVTQVFWNCIWCGFHTQVCYLGEPQKWLHSGLLLECLRSIWDAKMSIVSCLLCSIGPHVRFLFLLYVIRILRLNSQINPDVILVGHPHPLVYTLYSRKAGSGLHENATGAIFKGICLACDFPCLGMSSLS